MSTNPNDAQAAEQQEPEKQQPEETAQQLAEEVTEQAVATEPSKPAGQTNAQEEGAERRKSARRALRVAAVVTLSNAQMFEVRTLDIGVGGMAIVAPANPKPGITFNIKMNLPLGHDAVTFEAKVRVAHSIFTSAESGFKIGLTFIQLSPESATAVSKYIGSNP